MYKMKNADFGAKEWIEYYDCLNDEVPVEKLRLELDDEGKRSMLSLLSI